MRFLLCVFVCAVALGAVLALTSKERSVANFAVTELGPGYSLVKINSVKSQVVKGTMYHVKAKVRYQIPGGIEEKYNCYIKVWERLSGRMTVEESNCK